MAETTVEIDEETNKLTKRNSKAYLDMEVKVRNLHHLSGIADRYVFDLLEGAATTANFDPEVPMESRDQVFYLLQAISDAAEDLHRFYRSDMEKHDE